MKYIKKPVIVEAEQFTGDHTPKSIFSICLDGSVKRGMIQTEEGVKSVHQNDWIITDQERGRYVVSDEEFHDNFENYIETEKPEKQAYDPKKDKNYVR